MKYTISNNMLNVVVSSHGAELQSVRGINSQMEYLWQADPAIWGHHAPVLFPIVGRLKDDSYRYQGKTYHMGQHGFVRDQGFKVVYQSAESITFSLQANAETLKQYPFNFELRVNYNLLNNLLEENFTVINQDQKELIFGIGGHPGFNVPVDAKTQKEDYYFSCQPSVARVRIPLVGSFLDWQNRSIASTDSLITLSDHLFKKDALIFQLSGHKNRVSLRTDESHFHVNVWTRDAPFVGIWSQYPKTANYVCIEPWWGIADRSDSNGQLEDKHGMNRLKTGEKFTAGFGMAFHPKLNR
ncbi:MAG: aldose 1-epimerase family protein [Lactobacillus sp.]